MKIFGIALLLIGAMATQSYAQQRKRAVGQSIHTVNRCIDPILTSAEALEVIEWAKENKVLPRKNLHIMRYEINEEGEPVEKKMPLYPMFGTWKGSWSKGVEEWRPSDHGWPATLPDDIEWLVYCGSHNP